MQLYLVVCEIGNKKHIKRIYKTIDEAHQFFAVIRKEVNEAKPGTYRLVNDVEGELIIEELAETDLGENIQRRYTIVYGDIAQALSLILELTHDGTSNL